MVLLLAVNVNIKSGKWKFTPIGVIGLVKQLRALFQQVMFPLPVLFTFGYAFIGLS
jgi:hypothetical protein